MNKKFLSAILFGALMVTSTGTFVSCKDYDDDIENLQTQIDKNSSAIAELQKLVGQGKWVSSISSIENGFTVTMSDGSSVQIKGINGKDGVNGQDGKNGAEWTIGADGFWYVDGEKTENVAVGKNGENGKNGVSAPSPFIGTDGNWVVYAWDAEKGEFVEKATEIPAAGTSAYAVKANGVYTLYIADADGEMQEIALPATSDAFVVEAPASYVHISVDNAIWRETLRDKEEYAALLKAFPEIANIKKGDKMTQGAELPLMVNPTNIDLSDGFTFNLVDKTGKTVDIVLSNPVAGISENWHVGAGYMSRAAEDNAGLWTLSVAPAFDKENNGYTEIDGGAVIATNAKGTSVRTQFAYEVEVNPEFTQKVGVWKNSNLASVPFTETIDVLAPVYGTDKNQAIVGTYGMFEGKYILEVTNPVQEELYGLSVEGSKLNIAKMPENKLEIKVNLKMTVLGLNGSTNSAEFELVIGQQIGSTKTLADQKAELVKAKNAKEYQKIRYNVVDLGLSLVELDNLLNKNNSIVLTITREAERELPADEFGYVDTETVTWVAYNGPVSFYNAKGNPITTAYAGDPTDYVTFGFDFDPAQPYYSTVDESKYNTDAVDYEKFSPFEYNVVLNVENATNHTKIYGAEGILTVSNPATAQGSIELASAFVEEGVLQITGVPANGRITYDFMTEALIEKGVAKVTALKDLGYDKDNKAVLTDTTEKNNWDNVAGWNWISGTSLNVFTRTATNLEEGYFAFLNLYEPRQIEIEYSLFDNPNNKLTKVIDIIVKSELYNEDGTKAVEFDAAKLSAIFGIDDTETEDVTENAVDVKKAIKKAIVQAGTDKNKTYNLFEITSEDKVVVTPAKPAVYDYRINLAASGATPIFNDDHFNREENYVLDANNDLVKIDEADLKKFGMSAVNFAERDEDSKKYYITLSDVVTEDGDRLSGLYTLYKSWRKYYQQDGKKAADANGVYEFNGKKTVDEADAVAVELYNKYVANTTQKVYVKEETAKVDAVTKPADPTPRDSRVVDVNFEFVDADEAAKYVTANSDLTVLTAKEEAPSDVTGGKVEIAMIMTVEDAWGMIMEVPFKVTIKTAK